MGIAQAIYCQGEGRRTEEEGTYGEDARARACVRA